MEHVILNIGVSLILIICFFFIITPRQIFNVRNKIYRKHKKYANFKIIILILHIIVMYTIVLGVIVSDLPYHFVVSGILLIALLTKKSIKNDDDAANMRILSILIILVIVSYIILNVLKLNF